MSDWKVEYRLALIKAVITLGMPLAPEKERSIYRWVASDWKEIRKKIDTGIPVESSWMEFAGTFAESNDWKHGVDLDVVFNDGTVAQFRYDDTLGDLIQEVLRD